MSLKLRSLLVPAAGAVLGLTVAAGAELLARHPSQPAPMPVAAPSGISPAAMQLLTKVLDRVHAEYVDKIDDQQLVESAIQGVFANLDSHSRYLDPAEYAELRIDTSGSYSGVGLDVSVENGKVTIVTPLAGEPAARAGIRSGDVLVAVDHIAVNKSNIEESVDRIRGTAGTVVSLAVTREGRSMPLRFALTRTGIELKTVHSAYLGDGYAYVRLTSFAETTPGDLRQAASALIARAGQPLKGLVLDLRGNPGGVLNAAVGVADLFLDTGLIVRGEGRARGARFAKYAAPGGLLEKVPLAVLVDAGSASASEIVAGALQDHHRGPLVGVRTYGKGSVQTLMPLAGGRAIKLTTSLYLTPSGRSINGVGIEPNLVVHNASPDRQFHASDGAAARERDAQLSAALRLLGYNPAAVAGATRAAR